MQSSLRAYPYGYGTGTVPVQYKASSPALGPRGVTLGLLLLLLQCCKVCKKIWRLHTYLYRVENIFYFLSNDRQYWMKHYGNLDATSRYEKLGPVGDHSCIRTRRPYIYLAKE